MIENYLPILKAKKGEFDALVNLGLKQQLKMLPLFEISRIGEKKSQAKKYLGKDIVSEYLDEVAEQISIVRKGKLVLVDAYQWDPAAKTGSGEHIMSHIHSRLQQLGVIPVAVVGYDRWDSHEYRSAMINLPLQTESYYCLRLDSIAIEDSEEADYFKEQVFDIIDTLQVDPTDCGVMIDFGDLARFDDQRILVLIAGIFESLSPFGFKFYSIIGSSMPASIDLAVKKHDSTGLLRRREMTVWQKLRHDFPHLNLIFGDYGVRSANSQEDIIAPDANCKIRYATNQHFFVSRGHTKKVGGFSQMYNLAETIIQSPHYLGEQFSWGDSRIMACRNGEFTGNPTSWIAIDTNHHVSYVLAEIEEFEAQYIKSDF